jgi:hypothetical protein
MQQRALGITSRTNTTTSTGAAVNGQMSTRGATRSSTTTAAAAAAAAAASAAAVAKPVLTPEATRQAVIQWETHVQGLPIDPNTTVSALFSSVYQYKLFSDAYVVGIAAIVLCIVLQWCKSLNPHLR